MVPNLIPAFDYDEQTNLSDITLILIVVACVFPVILVELVYRWKKEPPNKTTH